MITYLINLIKQDKIIHTCYYWVIVYLRPNYEFEKLYNEGLEYNIHTRKRNINLNISQNTIKHSMICWIHMNMGYLNRNIVNLILKLN
jgi:hypothetical protein